jgi:hypothetical protein
MDRHILSSVRTSEHQPSLRRHEPVKTKVRLPKLYLRKGARRTRNPLVDNWELEWSSASRALMGDLEVKFCLPLTAQLARGPGNAEECQWAASAYTQA